MSYAVIGAGPSGLAAARNLQRFGIPWQGYELADGPGGLWDIEAPRSTVYESAHLISSKGTTQFAEFPMADSVADYPSHRELVAYFRAFAERFGLARGFRFRTEVTQVVPARGGGFHVTSVGPGGERTEHHDGVLIANGTLSEPNVPTFDGDFSGELFHTSGVQVADRLRRQARPDRRRRELRLRHRGRRRSPRRNCRDLGPTRLPLRAEVPVRQTLGLAQPGPAAARSHQAGGRQSGAADVHR